METNQFMDFDIESENRSKSSIIEMLPKENDENNYLQPPLAKSHSKNRILK